MVTVVVTVVTEIIRTTYVRAAFAAAILFEGGVYFIQELRIVRLLFEGGVCSKILTHSKL